MTDPSRPSSEKPEAPNGHTRRDTIKYLIAGMKPVPMNLLFPLSIFHSFSTMQFMRFLKRLIKSVPPFRKVFADRDALRVENARLFHENAALQTQSQKATGKNRARTSVRATSGIVPLPRE